MKHLKDEQVLDLLDVDDIAMTAVDVPFGWPVDFHSLLRAHELGPVASLPTPQRATEWRTRRAAWRETDRVIRAGLPGVTPLAVAFDRPGATAASWAVVETELDRRGHRLDRSGMSGRIVETYPTAVRSAVVDLPSDGRQATPLLDLNGYDSEFQASSHVRDACVAAVAARARATGKSVVPGDDVLHLARVEGWVHIPTPGVAMADLVGA